MKRKRSSSSQFEILYISKFERHEQDIYENRWDSRDKFSSHSEVHQTARDCVQHTMITTWYQSIDVFQLFSYRCEIEWASRYRLQSSSRFNKLFNFSMMTIIDQLWKKTNKKKQDWINNHCIEIESQLNINNWMMKVRWFKVLSTFLRLEQLSETQSLAFSEVEDWNKKYVCFEINCLYDLKKVESFYEKHILNIIFEVNCNKIKAINMFINDVWDKNEKTVFCIMSFMNAFILYWVNDKVSTFC